MPYIEEKERQRIRSEIPAFVKLESGPYVTIPSNLNYVILRLAWFYLRRSANVDVQRYPLLEQAIGGLRQTISTVSPYDELDDLCRSVGEEIKLHPGVFNYVISSILHSYIRRNGVSYSCMNALIGIIEQVKLYINNSVGHLNHIANYTLTLANTFGLLVCIQTELYRIILVPYENTKLLENGSVSDFDLRHVLPLSQRKGMCTLWED